MADADVPSFTDRVRYQVDRFLSWSPVARFMGLFGLSFLLVVGSAVLVHAVAPAEDALDFGDSLWWALTHVADTGTMGGDKGTLVRAAGIVATLCGIGVVAVLIGLVSTAMGAKLDDLRQGKSPVIDERHTLILGWGEKVFAILRELREANANQKQASIVILSTEDKEVVETAVRERMGDMGTTRVVVRQGSPSAVHDLRKVGAGRARSIIILSDEATAHAQEPGARDMPAIKALLALRRIPGALTRNHAVVELGDGERRAVVEQLGAGGVEVVAMGETLSRLMVQTSRQNGLAEVYRHLLSYEGSEFYFQAFPQLAGQPFGAAQWQMKDAVVCGVRRPGREGRPTQCLLNPADDFLLEAGDELLVIAEDDDSFSLGAQHQPVVSREFTGAAPIARQPERLLVFGHSPRLAEMLREFDHYVLPGSEAWLMPGLEKDVFQEYLRAEVGALAALKLKFVEGDPTLPEALRRVVTGDFSTALVVADTELPPDEADARTVITVLLLRDLFGALGERRPRLISEILDPRTKDLLEQDYGADFVVSSEMTSMLLAQVSERRDLNAVFADLFDSDGNELYLKRAACYAAVGQPTGWLAVQQVARQRGEVAIGYLQHAAAPVINPPQTAVLTLAAADRVIVISEDDREEAQDQRGALAELAAAPTPPSAHVPVARAPERSGLVPPEAPRPDARTVTAGPRVAGPSTMPRAPLPTKKG